MEATSLQALTNPLVKPVKTGERPRLSDPVTIRVLSPASSQFLLSRYGSR